MFKRVALFLATNLAVILVLSIVLRLLGVDSILDERPRRYRTADQDSYHP